MKTIFIILALLICLLATCLPMPVDASVSDAASSGRVDTGVNPYNARYYDAQLGRFISPDTIVQDPSNPQTLNRYSYVLNNPLKYTDPSGHVLDTFVDILSIIESTGEFINDPTWRNAGWLFGDIAGAIVPFVPSPTSIKLIAKGINALDAGGDAAAIARGVDNAPYGTLAGGCFVEDTSVQTATGIEPIQDIEPGEQVWSCDTEAGNWQLETVSATFEHSYSGDVVTIDVAGSEIVATGNHPFWVAAGDDLADRPWPEDIYIYEKAMTETSRWVEARDLRVGDELLLTGGQACITGLSTEDLDTTVYNIGVGELHTYAVSEAGVLVHNKALRNSAFVDDVPGGTAIDWCSKPHNPRNGHWDTIVNKTNELANTGEYRKIYVNKGLRNEIPGAAINRRPDIMAIRHDGLIDQFEIPSVTDDPTKLMNRMIDNRKMMGNRAGNMEIVNSIIP